MHAQLGRSRWLNVGVVRDQVHTERGEALGNEDPDPAEPHNADGLVRYFDAGVLGALPLTTVQRGIRGHNVARAREQQSHRQFRGADDVGGGCIHHHDTRLGGGLDVDVVQSNARARDHLQALRGCDGFRVNLRRRTDQDGIDIRDRRNQLIAIGSIAANHLEVRTQGLDGCRRQFFGDQYSGCRHR